MNDRDPEREIRQRVHSEDPMPDDPCVYIQWKGSDVCVDLYCECGHHGHYDGEFLYYYRCPECGRGYGVGSYVKLIPLTDSETERIESAGLFKGDSE